MEKTNVKINRVGERYTTTEGYEIEIIEYFNRLNCTIKFKNGYIVENIQVGQVILGNIKNPYHKSVCGIGYYGVGKYHSKKHKIIYDIWTSLIERCYSKKSQEKHPTYKDCSVHEHWHNFQNFAAWFEENYVEGFHLDKDILIKGNKIYSPETCCFVPRNINSLFIKRQNHRGDLPIGLRLLGNKFQVRLNKLNITIYLGVFDTIEEAFYAYKAAKEKYIKEVADKWKELIPEKTYQALYNYQVEITD